jgi:Zn finger protein HypA/HybF involved in hydrogenase expression
MKAKCLTCHWRGEVESPEIKSCPQCGNPLLHYLIDTSKKGVIEHGEKKKTES